MKKPIHSLTVCQKCKVAITSIARHLSRGRCNDQHSRQNMKVRRVVKPQRSEDERQI